MGGGGRQKWPGGLLVAYMVWTGHWLWPCMHFGKGGLRAGQHRGLEGGLLLHGWLYCFVNEEDPLARLS